MVHAVIYESRDLLHRRQKDNVFRAGEGSHMCDVLAWTDEEEGYEDSEESNGPVTSRLCIISGVDQGGSGGLLEDKRGVRGDRGNGIAVSSISNATFSICLDGSIVLADGGI